MPPKLDANRERPPRPIKQANSNLVNQYPIYTPPTPINTNDASALTYPLFNDTSKVTSSFSKDTVNTVFNGFENTVLIVGGAIIAGLYIIFKR